MAGKMRGDRNACAIMDGWQNTGDTLADLA
jgi:hypothetical protein